MSHSAVLFPVQSFINKSPSVSEPHSDGKPCSFFLWTAFICQISYCRTSMGLFGGVISLLRDWINPLVSCIDTQRVAVFVLTPQSVQDFSFTRLPLM